MADYENDEVILTAEEITELRIERYVDREHFYAGAAILFTIIVFAFGPDGGQSMRVWISGLAGAFFIMAGLNRLLRNLTLARRSSPR